MAGNQLRVTIAKGCLYVVVPAAFIETHVQKSKTPLSYRDNRRSRDGTDDYHITAVRACEVDSTNVFDEVKDSTIDANLLLVLGEGRAVRSSEEAFFLVVHHPRINSIRKQLDLPPSPTQHITLGFRDRDIHGVDKGISRITKPSPSLGADAEPVYRQVHNVAVLECIVWAAGEAACPNIATKLRILKVQRFLKAAATTPGATASSQDSVAAARAEADALVQRGSYIGHVLHDCMDEVLTAAPDNVALRPIQHIRAALSCYTTAHRDAFDADDRFATRMLVRHNAYSMALDPAALPSDYAPPASSASAACSAEDEAGPPGAHGVKSSAAFRRVIALRPPAAARGSASPAQEVVLHAMPRNFCWVIPNVLAGVSALRTEMDLLGLHQLGIRTVHYFLDHAHHFDRLQDASPVKVRYTMCENGMVPTLEDMEEALRAENFRAPVAFGCLGGFGRTGTALACFLTQWGTSGVPAGTAPGSLPLPAMSAGDAVGYLRSVRPKSIENALQLSFVHRYSNHLYARAAGGEESAAGAADGPIPRPPLAPALARIRLIMLVGLPGAGKSTFCQLFQSSGLRVMHVSQDHLGRAECEGSFMQCVRDSDVVLLDRTNLTAADRKQWLELSGLHRDQCLCVYLATPAFVCKERAKARLHHPTIRTGGGGRIISDAERQLEPPSARTEGFAAVVVLEDEEDVRNYLKKWHCDRIELEAEANVTDSAAAAASAGPSSGDEASASRRVDLVKFPRTQHLLNLGSASRDDLLVGSTDLYFSGKVDVEVTEKVDGAQLGFSIDPASFALRAQNRSHFVTSKSHSQFAQLDKFMTQHSQDLYAVLEDADHVLYGEWMFAKHSVGYSQLPSYFLAFDLFNKRTGEFYSRRVLEERLAGTALCIVPLLYRGPISNSTELLRMLQRKSHFSDTNLLEGVYLKINGGAEGATVAHRSKVVRADFICGNAHWSRHNVERNTVVAAGGSAADQCR